METIKDVIEIKLAPLVREMEKQMEKHVIVGMSLL